MRQHPALILALLALVAGCAEEVAERAPIEVVTDKAETRDYFPQTSFVGRLNARDDVQIKARVTGYLTSVDFREGENIEAGQRLYSLDEREFQAALASAKAMLASAKANREVADLNYRRGEQLLPKNAISQSEFDQLTAKKLEADAALANAEAGVKTAEVNLTYTHMDAPISGRIGRSAASVGDLVGPISGVLTTLVSIDPIEALFQVSESTYVAALEQRLAAAGEDRPEAEAELSDIEVTLELTNRQTYPYKGYIDYFANRIDENTGTIEGRALIPNPRGILVPGQYVRVSLASTNPLSGLFVPQAAIQADQQGSFVMVVGNDKIVQRRNVELGERFDADIRVLRGVDDGDEVIVRGLQLVRPGQVVTTRLITDAGE